MGCLVMGMVIEASVDVVLRSQCMVIVFKNSVPISVASTHDASS